jgi:hypothetical protein
MRKLGLVFLTIVSLNFIGFTQSPKNLTGPKAKNYKPWEHTEEYLKIHHITYSKKPVLQKPNQTTQNSLVKETQHINHNAHRPQLIGPKAKNYTPWID